MKYLAAICIMSLTLLAQAQTQGNNAASTAALKPYPRSNASGDRVVSQKESQAFRKNAESQKVDAAGGNEDNDDKTATKHIYKTVGRESLALYVWKPQSQKADAKFPAIVFFHGGGFRKGDYTQFREQSRHLASRGMVAVSVNYRLITERGVKVEDCVEDAKSAMRWVRSNAAKLGVDPDRIASGGGSAGGYLAVATLMVDDINAKTDPPNVSAKPNAMVLFNPGYGGRGVEEGKVDPRDPEGKGDLAKYVKPNQPPSINFFGTADPLLPAAVRFKEAYLKASNRCEMVTYEGEGHSFFNKKPYNTKTLDEADKFLVGLGWLEKNSAAPGR